MIKKIQELDPALIFLAYPNNPTGTYLEKKELINLSQKKIDCENKLKICYLEL